MLSPPPLPYAGAQVASASVGIQNSDSARCGRAHSAADFAFVVRIPSPSRPSSISSCHRNKLAFCIQQPQKHRTMHTSLPARDPSRLPPSPHKTLAYKLPYVRPKSLDRRALFRISKMNRSHTAVKFTKSMSMGAVLS